MTPDTAPDHVVTFAVKRSIDGRNVSINPVDVDDLVEAVERGETVDYASDLLRRVASTLRVIAKEQRSIRDLLRKRDNDFIAKSIDLANQQDSTEEYRRAWIAEQEARADDAKAAAEAAELVEAENASLADEVYHAHGSYKAAEAALGNMADRLQSLNHVNAALKERLNGSQRARGELGTQLLDVGRELGKTKDQLAEAERAKAELHFFIAEQQRELGSIRAGIDRFWTLVKDAIGDDLGSIDYGRVDGHAEALAKAIATVRADREAAETEANGLRDKIARLECGYRNGLEQRIARLEWANGQLITKLSAVRKAAE